MQLTGCFRIYASMHCSFTTDFCFQSWSESFPVFVLCPVTYQGSTGMSYSNVALCNLCTISIAPKYTPGADSRFAPSQWETALLCNDVSHWLGARLEWTLLRKYPCTVEAMPGLVPEHVKDTLHILPVGFCPRGRDYFVYAPSQWEATL